MGRPKKDEARKEEILEAFERCVIREGVTGTTLQKVANEANLPRSLVRYFVGNRDQMVELLITRVIARASIPLQEFSPDNTEHSLSELLDFLFDGAFKNNTANGVVDRLWELANTDDEVKNALVGMYSALRTHIEKAMKTEGVGATSFQRSNTAQLLLSLAYGEASFAHLGMSSGKKGSSRQLAELVITQLSSTKGQ